MASGTINATGQTVLRTSAEPGTVATKVIQFKSNAFSGSIVLKARNRNPDKVTAFLPIPYKRRNVAGVVSDDTTVTAAITDSGLFEVNVAGLDLQLDSTVASGTMDYDVVDLLG